MLVSIIRICSMCVIVASVVDGEDDGLSVPVVIIDEEASDWNEESATEMRDELPAIGREDDKVEKVVLMLSVSWS